MERNTHKLMNPANLLESLEGDEQSKVINTSGRKIAEEIRTALAAGNVAYAICLFSVWSRSVDYDSRSHDLRVAIMSKLGIWSSDPDTYVNVDGVQHSKPRRAPQTEAQPLEVVCSVPGLFVHVQRPPVVETPQAAITLRKAIGRSIRVLSGQLYDLGRSEDDANRKKTHALLARLENTDDRLWEERQNLITEQRQAAEDGKGI
jgi:hypothetical protein